jgi:hypothetical protein
MVIGSAFRKVGGAAAGRGAFVGDLAAAFAPVQVGRLEGAPCRRHQERGVQIVHVLAGTFGHGRHQAPLDLVRIAGHGGHELGVRPDQPHPPQVAIGVVQAAGELGLHHRPQRGQGILFGRAGQQLLPEALDPLRVAVEDGVFLGGEVVEKSARRHVGSVRDRVDRGAGQAALLGQGEGGFVNGVSSCLLLPLPAGGCQLNAHSHSV